MRSHVPTLILLSVTGLLGDHTCVAQPIRSLGITPDFITRVVRAHQRALNHCHAQAVRTRRDTPQQIEVSFSIEPDGNVSRVTFNPTAANFELGSCLGRVLATLRFPAPNGGATVTTTYPFDFRR